MYKNLNYSSQFSLFSTLLLVLCCVMNIIFAAIPFLFLPFLSQINIVWFLIPTTPIPHPQQTRTQTHKRGASYLPDINHLRSRFISIHTFFLNGISIHTERCTSSNVQIWSLFFHCAPAVRICEETWGLFNYI